MDKKVKSIPFEVKINENKRTFSGYASTFGNLDQGNDIVQPGAFKKTIAERMPLRQIKILFNHNPLQPIGLPIHMEEDTKGLYVEGKISDTTLGNDVLELMRDRVIDRMSIGYDTIQEDYEQGSGARLLKELKLYEFSPVTFPMNEEAVIGQVKTVADLEIILNKTVGGDMAHLLKEGRVLSKATYEKVKTAIDALQEILYIADPQQSGPPKDTHKATATLLKGIDPSKLEEILNLFKH